MLNIKHPLYQQDLSFAAEAINKADIAGARILITGASGMIGSFIADTFAYYNSGADESERAQVYVMARDKERLKERFGYCDKNSKIFLLPGDVREPLPEGLKFDYILHSASNTHPLDYANDPVGTITTNVMGLYNLLTHSSKYGIKRLLFVSTVEIYGENKGDKEAFDESYCGYIDCNTLRAGYPESKRLCESMCQAFIKDCGLDIAIVRLPRIYGPTMLFSDSKASSQFIKKAVAGEDIVLKSDGEQFYSYACAADAAYASLFVLFSGARGEAYNAAGCDSGITIWEFARGVASLAGTNVVFELPSDAEKTGFSKVTKAVLDTSKLRSLGWRPRYDTMEGLKRTYMVLKGEEG